jgi:hypothetical protein
MGVEPSVAEYNITTRSRLTENTKWATVDQMINEFDIELPDDYLNYARKFRFKNGNMK